jgi:Holliday junction resolvase
MRYLKSLSGVYAVNIGGSASMAKGTPDILACIDGKFVAFEVKTQTGKLMPQQAVRLRQIEAAGGLAYVVRSVAEVEAAVRDVMLPTSSERPTS